MRKWPYLLVSSLATACAFGYYVWPFRFEPITGGLIPTSFDHLTHEKVTMGEHGWETLNQVSKRMEKDLALSRKQEDEAFWPKAQVTDNSQVYPITISAMDVAFDDNMLKAETWLKGKRVSITGRANVSGKIGSGFGISLGEMDNEPTTSKACGAVFWFSTDELESVASKIHDGDIARCEGTYEKINEDKFGVRGSHSRLYEFKGLSIEYGHR